MSNRDFALLILEDILYSSDKMDYFELLDRHGNEFKWALVFVKEKDIKKRVREIKKRALESTLDKALNDSEDVDYFSLMNKYKEAFRWGLRFSKDAGIKRRIKNLKRRALVVTAKKLYQEGPVNPMYIRKHHTRLIDASRTVHDSPEGVDAWNYVLNDAGITLPANKRVWSLKMLFDYLESISNNPEDIKHRKVHKRDQYLSAYARKKFGKYGKAVILIGIDILSFPRYRSSDYKFSFQDFRTLMDDKSLSDDRKIAYAFNALALQYYDFLNEYNCFSKRVLDSDDNFTPHNQRFYFRNKLCLSRLCENFDYRTRIELNPEIPGRIHRVDFCFVGERAQEQEWEVSERFHEEILKA